MRAIHAPHMDWGVPSPVLSVNIFVGIYHLIVQMDSFSSIDLSQCRTLSGTFDPKCYGPAKNETGIANVSKYTRVRRIPV